MDTGDDVDGELPPSKSARKRAAHALQKLGERLVRMKPADVAALPLPETLAEAIEEARRLRARGALARQFQYIGKLMRDIDLDALEQALERLEAARNPRGTMRR